jgi:hypothetical protein
VVAVAVAFTIAQCGGSVTTPSHSASQSPTVTTAAPQPEVRTAVAKTLAARAAAVLHHDKAAYLATDATGDWRSLDAGRFDSLMAIPLAEWGLDLDGGATGLANLYQVRLSYQISGADPQPVEATQYLSFVQQGGDWVVSSDTGGDAAGKHTDVQIWDQGAVSVVHGSRSLVIGLGGEERLKPFADLADHGAAKAAKVWGAAGWHGTVVVEVPTTQAQAEALVKEQPGGLQQIAALTSGEAGKATASAPASRVLVNPDQFSALPPESWQVVMDHELTHVATRVWNTAETPIWLTEGAADYSAYQDSAITVTRMLKDLREAAKQSTFDAGVLPTETDFQGANAGIAYEEANLACRMISEKYGQAKLVAFYKAVGTAPAGTADPVDQAFHSVLGTSAKDFTTKWKQYVLIKARS